MKKTELIAVRTNPEIKHKLEKMAEEQDRSISYIVNKIIENFFKENSNAPQ